MKHRSKRNKKVIVILGWILVAAFVLTTLLSSLMAVHAEEYGEDAYYYVQYLESHYPRRAVASATLDATADWLKQEIQKMGYSFSSQPFSTPSGEYIINGENIWFTKPGASDQVIVVGAHYDSVMTNGTDDNASGVGVLLETAARVSAGNGYPYTIRFVLFSAEEPGCFGSKYYVENLSEEDRGKILCMINLDTLGAGDNMYLYGGGVNDDGTPNRTWLVEQALNVAAMLGLEMDTHPDVNPEFPVPTKTTASDQAAFNLAGIPYLYCEASNWNGGPMTNFFQTADPAVENGKMMHVEAYENIAFYVNTFGTRFADHLKAYAQLVDYLLRNIVPDNGAPDSVFETRSEKVESLVSMNVRSRTSVASEILDALDIGDTVTRTGYNPLWSRIVTEVGQTGYVKTEFLKSLGGQDEEEETETGTEEAETETEEKETEAEETDAKEEEQESEGQEPEDEDLVTEEESGSRFSEDEEEGTGETESVPDTASEEAESLEKDALQEESVTESVSETEETSTEEAENGSDSDIVRSPVGNGRSVPGAGGEIQEKVTAASPNRSAALSVDHFVQMMQDNPVILAGVIGAIVLAAVILCLVIYLLQNRHSR